MYAYLKASVVPHTVLSIKTNSCFKRKLDIAILKQLTTKEETKLKIVLSYKIDLHKNNHRRM